MYFVDPKMEADYVLFNAFVFIWFELKLMLFDPWTLVLKATDVIHYVMKIWNLGFLLCFFLHDTKYLLLV